MIKKYISLLFILYFFMCSKVYAESITVDKYIEELAKNDNVNLIYDGTVDNNLRYIGSNPNNYVSFNNELWRIIGVMNNIDDGNGNIESRIKLIRYEPLGKYAWDSSLVEVNSGGGINEWSTSDLMNELNSDYLNTELTENTFWYSFGYDEKEAEFDVTKVISKEFQTLIDSVVWYTGSNGTNSMGNVKTGLVSHYYNYERGNLTGKTCTSVTANCNDTVERTTRWTGKIGLINVSDYGFATGGTETHSRDYCFATSPYSWKGDDYLGCLESNWLYNSNYEYWTINAKGGSNDGRNVFKIMASGKLSAESACVSRDVFPTLYLNTNVLLAGGNGTFDEPYLISELYQIKDNTKDQNGTIIIDTETATVADKITININPNKGYTLDKILVNGTDMTNYVQDNKLILEKIMTNQNIEVSFKEIPVINDTDEEVKNPDTFDSLITNLIVILIFTIVIIVLLSKKMKKFNI